MPDRPRIEMNTTKPSRQPNRPAGIESAVIELRYPDAYQIWDRAGRIWSELCGAFSNLEIVEAEPRMTHFKLNNKYELSVQLNQAFVKSFFPKPNLSDFFDVVGKFFPPVLSQLEIDVLTRIGFRVIWSKEYPSIHEATESVLRLELVNVPEHRFSIKGADIDRPDIRIRWESDRLGTHLQVRAEKRQINFAPPLHLTRTLPPIDDESCVAVYDVDYYTVAPVGVGQLSLVEWMSQAFQAIKKNGKSHLSELGV